MITGKTKLLGVIGHPIEHSLSPVMHNAAITDLEMDYVYLPLPVQPADLASAMTGFAAIELQGFSVTIPHKQAIIPFLTAVSPIAQAVGAVNTVWRTESGWRGTNTDVEGFVAPLKALDHDWTQAEVIILGNGGAARAVVVGCTQLGCPQVHVVGRDPQKLEQFQQSWNHAPLSVNLQTHLWQQLPEILPHAALLVNTTPIGMYPQVNDSPLAADAIALLPDHAIAYDLIYTPNPTQFLQIASQRQLVAIDGLEMLVQQGAAALTIWLQQPAPVEIMRRSLRRHLGWEP